MTQLFTINDCSIHIEFQEHSIHITNNAELWKLLDGQPGSVTLQLVSFILEQYQVRYGRTFGVHPDSLIVEIWGHVYFEYFTLIFEQLFKLKLVKTLTAKLISYCEVIDCGEEGYDNNRCLWDSLAPFTELITDCLPRSISIKNLKK